MGQDKKFSPLTRIICGFISIPLLWVMAECIQLGDTDEAEAFFRKIKNVVSETCAEDGAQSTNPVCVVKLSAIFLTGLAPWKSEEEQTEAVYKKLSAFNLQLHPELTQPNLKPEEVLAWAQHVAQETMRFDFTDYSTHMVRARSNFTTLGWIGFRQALEDSKLVRVVMDRKLTVTLTTLSPPEFTRSDLADTNGVYTWRVKMPVSIRFDGSDPANNPAPMQTNIMLRIERSSLAYNTNGIGIGQWLQIR